MITPTPSFFIPNHRTHSLKFLLGGMLFSCVAGTAHAGSCSSSAPSDCSATEENQIARPEAGAYNANLAAANKLFITDLNDRLGETHYIDVLTGEQKITSMWLYTEGGHNRFRDNSGQLSTQANRYTVQLGGDIAQWSFGDVDRFHVGVMAGYGDSKSTTDNRIKGHVNGYSTGIYGVWQSNEPDSPNMYMDGWVRYSWFNNTVTTGDLPEEKYKSSGLTASFEIGYLYEVAENNKKNWRWFIQPQAQVIAMEVKDDEHTQANGTLVMNSKNHYTQFRLGVRAFANGYSDLDYRQDRVFQPFVEINWLHNNNEFSNSLDDVIVKQTGTKNIAELKVGVEGQISKQFNLWGNISQQVGSQSYSDTSAMLGMKYLF